MKNIKNRKNPLEGKSLEEVREDLQKIRSKSSLWAGIITISVMSLLFATEKATEKYNIIDKDKVVLQNNRKVIMCKKGTGSLEANLIPKEGSWDNAVYLSIYDVDADGIAERYGKGPIIITTDFSNLGKKACPDSLQKLYQEAYQLSKFSKEENRK